jgi:pimeloyl-ACP methyl ester carboxylesterase
LLVPLLVDDPVAPYMREARNFLKTWKKPTLVMFGSEDDITRGADHMFARLIPHARVVPIAEGGHFIPESHPEILVHNVIGFIKKAK